ncbi:MAG: DUF2628 domain-containing protein [Hyphomicrobiaceae bacterium]
MRTFTVHEPPETNGDRLDRAEAMVFVREGFSWLAALFAPLWLLLRGIWPVFFGYIAVGAMLWFVLPFLGLPRVLSAWLMVGLNLAIGFEADALRRWSLNRRGFRSVGIVSGRTIEDCERRFFDAWLDGQPFVYPGDNLAVAGHSGGRLNTLSLSGRSG